MKTEIAQWIEKAKISIEQKTKERWPTCQLNWLTLGYDKGPKFIKLWTNRPGTASKSAYAFLDMEGNIYKAKFPTAANAKKIDSEMRAWNDFTHWRAKYMQAAFRKPTKTPEEEIDDALEKIDRLTTVRDLLKDCNKLKTREERAAFIKEHKERLTDYKGLHLRLS